MYKKNYQRTFLLASLLFLILPPLNASKKTKHPPKIVLLEREVGRMITSVNDDIDTLYEGIEIVEKNNSALLANIEMLNDFIIKKEELNKNLTIETINFYKNKTLQPTTLHKENQCNNDLNTLILILPLYALLIYSNLRNHSEKKSQDIHINQRKKVSTNPEIK